MMQYRVRTGSLDVTHECPYEADAEMIAAIVLDRAGYAKKEHKLGELLLVSGAQFGPEDSDENMYLSTVSVLKKIGRIAP